MTPRASSFSRMTCRARRHIVALIALLAAPIGVLQSQRPDTTGTIVGVVVAKEGGAALPYSIVSIPSIGIERLTNERGEFVIANAPRGSIELLVRHLGYTPAKIPTTVRAGATDSVRVGLSRLAVQLAAVQVQANRVCVKPGPPNAATDAAFAAVFDQLRQNADQYRLLSSGVSVRLRDGAALDHSLRERRGHRSGDRYGATRHGRRLEVRAGSSGRTIGRCAQPSSGVQHSGVDPLCRRVIPREPLFLFRRP